MKPQEAVAAVIRTLRSADVEYLVTGVFAFLNDLREEVRNPGLI